MNTAKPLTKKQQRFAEDHHDLIYAFLRDMDLERDEFYDVAVFGYLKAIRRYLSNRTLRKYAFTTIAWQAMRREVYLYRQSLRRPSRNAPTVSLSELTQKGGLYTWEDVLGVQDRLMQELETELLLHELTKALPSPTNRIVAMCVEGYSFIEIGKALKLRAGAVKKLLDDSYDTVTQILYRDNI